MRIDVKKFLFIGPFAEKETFFHEAQKVGVVEFIHAHSKRQMPLTLEAERLAAAIKVLRGAIQEKQAVVQDEALATKATTQILNAKEVIDKAENEQDTVAQEIEFTEPFGNFSLDDIVLIEKETKQKMNFYLGKTVKHLSQLSDELIFINSQEGLDYFIALQEEPIKHKDLIQIHITHSLSHLKEKESALAELIATKNNEIRELTRYNWLLHYALTQEINKADLDYSTQASGTALENSLFVVEGWVPETQVKDLLALASSLNVVCDEVIIETSDLLPTYLENKGPARIGEDIINIYDTPSTQDKDPSLWVLGAFALFFAMIVGDAGYGLIFLLTALYLRFKTKIVKESGKRLVKLMFILGISCTLWGVLMSSYFALQLGSESVLRKNSLVEWMMEKKADYHLAQKDDVYGSWLKKYPAVSAATNGGEFLNAGEPNIAEKFSDNIMLELALFIGSVHVILGLLRYSNKNLMNVGWVAFVVGAYLYLPVFINATSLIHYLFGVNKVRGAEFGLQLLCGGIAFAVIIGLFKQGIFAIFESLQTIQIFADIMSYLRIYALALAGAIVAATVNDMAGRVPLLFGIFIIIFGHLLNITLSVMGGVIHGLRLNFLEWYHYSFEGGGKKFRPLRLRIFE